LYRRLFKPSATLQRPYAILCLPLILADTDEEARYLSTSSQQRVLALMYGKPLYLPPPVTDMDLHWDFASKRQVENFLALAVVGSPTTVSFKLQTILKQFEVDELMFTNDIYDRSKRLHALSLLNGLDVSN
jgi:alkanesulfonate monooxygenase SsuD/methylene tetrahydromethanopterin reductase-like flavin-dependent oxidoreductase (luciferase family)